MGVGHAFGRLGAMQGRHDQPTKNAIRIALLASRKMWGCAKAIELYIGLTA